MKISLGEQIIIAQDINHAQELIQEFEATAINEQKIVSHYLIDGIEIADLDAYLEGKDSETIQHIVVITKTPQEMIKETLTSFLTYLPALQEGLQAIKENLTLGETIAVEDWRPLLDGLEWTNQLLSSLSILLPTEEEQLPGLVSRWGKQLSEMMLAWENKDLVLLADIMEYEILEVLEELQTYFNNYLAQEE